MIVWESRGGGGGGGGGGGQPQHVFLWRINKDFHLSENVMYISYITSAFFLCQTKQKQNKSSGLGPFCRYDTICLCGV